jgi:hypothetical protein
MQSKKTIIIIVISIGVAAIVAPLVYDFMERMAVTNLKIKLNKIELSNVDLSNTNTFNSLQQTLTSLSVPSISTLSNVMTLESNLPTENQLAVDLLVNTKYSFNVYLDANNPSLIPVVLDRTSIKTYISGHELSGEISLPQKETIPPGGSKIIELQGITISGSDIANVIAGSASNDFNLYFFFDLTSYYPTLFGEIPIPIKIDLHTYPIPQKPDLYDFQRINVNVNTFTIFIKNNHEFPISGTLFIGALKGNDFGCNPACFAPIDNGLATFLRIKGDYLFDIQTYQFYKDLSPWQIADVIVNPSLRNYANSALIMMWEPSQSSSIPYTVTIDVGGISSTSSGTFESNTLATARNFIYYGVRNFGYVGEKEFTSAYVPTYSNNQYSPSTTSNGGTTTTQSSGDSNSLGNLVNQAQQAIQGAIGAITNALQPVKQKTYVFEWFNGQTNWSVTRGTTVCSQLGVFTLDNQGNYVGIPYAQAVIVGGFVDSQNQMTQTTSTTVQMNNQGRYSACTENFDVHQYFKIMAHAFYYGNDIYDGSVGNWVTLTGYP